MSKAGQQAPRPSKDSTRGTFLAGVVQPALRYGAYLLFVLLVVRLTYVGTRGVPLPEPGHRAATYFIAPKPLTCDKPDPNYPALAEKVKNEVSPVYRHDNSFLDARIRQLQDLKDRLAADVQAIRDLQDRIHKLGKKKGKDRPIKESPFYKKGNGTTSPDAAEPPPEAETRETLEAQIKEARGRIRPTLETLAPGLSPQQAEPMITALLAREEAVDDLLDCAAAVMSEVRTWLIVEAADFPFQRDRARGIVLAGTGRKLGETDAILPYATAVEQVREQIVRRTIQQSYPKLKDKKRTLQGLVTYIVLSNVRANLRRDEVKTEQALQAALDQLPKTTAVEFQQGQTILALGDVAEQWQRDCIAKFSTLRFASGEDLGQLWGVPIDSWLLLAGIALIAAFAPFSSRRFLESIFEKTKLRTKDYVTIGLLLLLHLALMRLFQYVGGVFHVTYPDLKRGILFAACPIALSPMIINVLLGPRAAVIATLFLLVPSSVIVLLSGTELLAGDFGTWFPLYMMVTSLAGIWVTRRIARRGAYFLSGLVCGFTSILFWGIVFLLEGGHVNAAHMLQLAAASGIAGGFSYILLISITPMFEYLLDYVTNSRLLELASTDHPALKELSKRAPGTYQHALTVANLVEEAADKVGANPLMAKVGAYYHDLGKLAATEDAPGNRTIDSSLYFAENQPPAAVNPHDDLSPLQSVRILRRHVEQSVRMARRYRLGKKVMDMAWQHHGTSLIEHFYNKALLEAQIKGGEVPETEFRYPGPKPQNKEAGVILLADAVEAAVRSLPLHTEERITDKVSEIIGKKIKDGQLDDSALTFGNVKTIQEIFIRTLVNMYHARPEYLVVRKEDRTVRLRRDVPAAPDTDTVELPRKSIPGAAPPQTTPPAGTPANEPGKDPKQS